MEQDAINANPVTLGTLTVQIVIVMQKDHPLQHVLQPENVDAFPTTVVSNVQIVQLGTTDIQNVFLVIAILQDLTDYLAIVKGNASVNEILMAKNVRTAEKDFTIILLVRSVIAILLE